MSRKLLIIAGVMMAVAAGRVQAQSPLQIRAAATSPVSGWEQVTSQDHKQVLWVAPTSPLTLTDIDRADASTTSGGDPAVTVVFTADGATKMAALSAAQLGKPIAILLDGKLIWAPVVRGELGKDILLSGGPGGLTGGEIQRLLAAFRRR
jgi:preprotein translocase subunit SecD